jgi:hypothetical protein
MFGHHHRKRERKKLRRERSAFETERKAFEAQRPAAEAQDRTTEAQRVSEVLQRKRAAREERGRYGIEQGEALLNRNVQGLTPREREAMSVEANQRINRNLHAAQGKLATAQPHRATVGISRTRDAQHRSLQREAQEQQGQVQRDIDRLEADQRRRHLAALAAYQQGEMALGEADEEKAEQELKHENELKRQRAREEQFNRLFSRL